MALSNVACLLAERSVRDDGVLMIDWDLEAPGLHRFFRNYFHNKFGSGEEAEQSLNEHPGLIDYFLELEKASRQLGELGEEEAAECAAQVIADIDLDMFVIKTDLPSLSLMKSGRQDQNYASHVNGFDWQGLYRRAPLMIRLFAERLASRYAYVLIDSRTGLTDTSGICTMIMPERLVLVFTPNLQSLIGIGDLARQATQYRRNSDDIRPLIVFPLPSRIEASRDDLRADWRFGNAANGIVGYQPLFQTLLSEIYSSVRKNLSIGGNLSKYFDEVQIQQVPDYAYGEEIAVLVEQAQDRFSLRRSYKSFTGYLVDSEGPWTKPTPWNLEIAAESPSRATMPLLPSLEESGDTKPYFLARIEHTVSFFHRPSKPQEDSSPSSEYFSELRSKLLQGFDLRKPRLVTVKGTLFPCALLNTGWWERQQIPLRTRGWRDPVQEWLFYGFDMWGPSWDFTWNLDVPERSNGKPRFFAQLGTDDEADSMPVIIPRRKAQKLREKLERDRGGWEVEITALLTHRLHFGSYGDESLYGGLLDYCLWLDDEDELHTLNMLPEHTKLYSGYLWKCLAPRAAWMTKGKSLVLKDVYVVWEHINFAEPAAVRYGLDAIKHKEEYIRRMHGELVLIQKSSWLVPGQPEYDIQDAYDIVIGKTEGTTLEV